MNELNLVTRSCPALIIFIVDMSGSMAEKIFYEGKRIPKCDAISQIVNISISEIIDRCVNGTEHRDYFNLVILGYNGEGVTSLLKSYCSEGREYATVNDLEQADIKPITYGLHMMVDGEMMEVTRKSKTYISIKPFHTTPMYSALQRAYDIGRKWCKEKGVQSAPPIFINITDGEASDATTEDLLMVAGKIKSLSTNRGGSIFVNIHVSTTEQKEKIIFPLESKGLKDIKFGNLLYDMSSELSPEVSSMISRQTDAVWHEGDRLRAVGYNTSISQLFNVLQIGSLSAGI